MSGPRHPALRRFRLVAAPRMDREELLNAERDALFFDIDIKHLGFNGIAFL